MFVKFIHSFRWTIFFDVPKTPLKTNGIIQVSQLRIKNSAMWCEEVEIDPHSILAIGKRKGTSGDYVRGD